MRLEKGQSACIQVGLLRRGSVRLNIQPTFLLLFQLQLLFFPQRDQ